MKTPDEYMEAAEECFQQSYNIQHSEERRSVLLRRAEAYGALAAAAANIEYCRKSLELQEKFLTPAVDSVNHGSLIEETPVLTGYDELNKRLTAMDKRLTEVETLTRKLQEFAEAPKIALFKDNPPDGSTPYVNITRQDFLNTGRPFHPSVAIPTVEAMPVSEFDTAKFLSGATEYSKRWQELYSKEHPGQTDFVDGEPTEEMKAKVREIAEQQAKETFACERCGKDTLRSDMKIAHFHMSDAEAYCVNIHQICSGCYGLFSRLAGRLFSGDEYKFLTSGWNFRNKVNHGSQDSE